MHFPFSDQGVYLDCTFGAGGHSRGIAGQMSACSRLYALDADDEAAARAAPLAEADGRFHFERANFAEAHGLCERWRLLGRVNAALADLGVSSPQLDDAHRGFAFRLDAPLDMRMDRRARPDAREWINTAEPAELRRVFAELGQLRRPGKLARAIERYRRKTAIDSTRQLADLIAAVEPAPASRAHPATNAFRAIRMHINNELGNLASLLGAMSAVLASGGRLLIICFHSLEARAVKSALRQTAPRKLPVTAGMAGGDGPGWRLLAKLRPGAGEIDSNPRARSASLFVLERS